METSKLNEILKSYKVNASVDNINDNIFFIEYTLIPEIGFNIKKLQNNINNIQLFFDYPITLEIVNNKPIIKENKPNRQTVDFFRTWERPLQNNLPLLIGVDSSGLPIYADLTKLPHLLVAGATGSGKSVFLHDCIMSLLQTHKSNLLLIDLKRVELSLYAGLNEIDANGNIITDAIEANKVLKLACALMDRRYQEFEQLKVRNFEEYQKIKPEAKYLTIVIDELADLMLNKSIRKEVENSIVRIAQLARAVGIHLIVATQRPSTDVITGLIKANIPSRVSFSVASAVDSRVILDKSGAETLCGNGDGFYKPIGLNNIIRFQACYISTEKIKQYAENNKPKYFTIETKKKNIIHRIFKKS